MWSRPARLPLLVVALLAAAARVRAAEPLAVLYLVGDAGVKASESALVFDPLAAAAAKDGGRSVVAILGDNIYPAGLPPAGDPARGEMESRLDAQIAAARAAGRVVVVPGNHDWGQWKKDGWAALRREEDFVNERGGPNVTFAPSGGCPGPVVFDLGDAVRLIVLDTHWWLHEYAKPEGPASPCAQKSEDDVVTAIREALRSAGGRKTVVLAHHPIESGGRSGSHFGWRDHLFPLTHLRGSFWLPLPVFGTLGVGGRILFPSPQQMVSPAYRRLKEAMARAFDPEPPLVWAAGHEHSLQVIRLPGPGTSWNLISGAGGGPRSVTPADPVDGTIFHRSVPGYMRIAFDEGGRVRLTVVGVPAPGRPEVLFAADLN